MIYKIIDEIEKALDADLHIVALMAALSLPDICDAVEYPDLGTTARYKKWYAEHIGQYEHNPNDTEYKMPYASADIIYDLRCSLLHAGNPSVDYQKQKIKEFTLNITKDMSYGWYSSYSHADGNRTLEIAIKNICWKICSLAKWYYEHNKEKFKFNHSVKDLRNYGI